MREKQNRLLDSNRPPPLDVNLHRVSETQRNFLLIKPGLGQALTSMTSNYLVHGRKVEFFWPFIYECQISSHRHNNLFGV